MKAIHVNSFGGPEVLKYSDVPTPNPDSHQVLINVDGASVNYADLKARSGAYHLGKKPPFIPGLDAAGRVVAVGASVTGVAPGDKVVAFAAAGSYAEKVIADENLVFKLPENSDPLLAAPFPLAGGAALHMLRTIAGIREGETVLIHAASGGVGTLAMQLARLAGASKVVATSRSSLKEKHLRQFGADEVVDLSGKNVDGQLAELSGNRGFDIILNPVGGDTLKKDLTFLAPFGRLINFGRMTDTPGLVEPESLYTTNRSLTGYSFGHFRKHRPRQVRETMEQLLKLAADRKIRVPVEHFSLEKADEAHALLEEGTVVGKVVLVPGR